MTLAVTGLSGLELGFLEMWTQMAILLTLLHIGGPIIIFCKQLISQIQVVPYQMAEHIILLTEGEGAVE